jgi:hypothetical protein
MAPDADKERQGVPSCPLQDSQQIILDDLKQANEIANVASLEVVFKQVVNDFSYIERPVRCLLNCKARDKNISFNGKNGVFLSNSDSTITSDEVTLIENVDGTILIQGTKDKRYLCSNSSGVVYASGSCHDDLEKWILAKSECGGFSICSFVSKQKMTCTGNIICTQDNPSRNHIWSVNLTSGELCLLSLPKLDMRLRCDLAGNLSLSNNCLGWEAWRLSEVGDGYIRISPWAHSGIFLSSNNKGEVRTTEKRGESENWSVEKAPFGSSGVVIKSANTGRILCQQNYEELPLCTVLESSTLTESCIWDLESLHRQTYYLVSTDNERKNVGRLEATRKGIIGTRNFPMRLTSEEWKIETTSEDGVVMLYSNGSQRYLGSSSSGGVFLMDKPNDKSSEKWIIEEREGGNALVSQAHQRVLVCPEKAPICTVLPGTKVMGTTRWKLEPKIPKQMSKEKMQAVGAALAIGLATTVATPFVIGGAIGVIGITQIGVAGQVAIGSIRAAEALSTITRLTLSSSELMSRQPSMVRGDSIENAEGASIGNRPFCSWRSW